MGCWGWLGSVIAIIGLVIVFSGAFILGFIIMLIGGAILDSYNKHNK